MPVGRSLPGTWPVVTLGAGAQPEPERFSWERRHSAQTSKEGLFSSFSPPEHPPGPVPTCFLVFILALLSTWTIHTPPAPSISSKRASCPSPALLPRSLHPSSLLFLHHGLTLTSRCICTARMFPRGMVCHAGGTIPHTCSVTGGLPGLWVHEARAVTHIPLSLCC